MAYRLDHLSRDDCATLLGLGLRQLDKLTASTAIPRRGTGRKVFFVWAEVRDAYISNKLAQIKPAKLTEDEQDRGQAELRKINADATLSELKAAKLQSELVDVAYIEASIGAIYANIKTKLLSIPAKLTPRLVGLTNKAQIKALLTGQVRETCAEMVQIAQRVPNPESEVEDASS